MIDSNHPKIIAFAHDAALGTNPCERAVSLFYAVRDGFRYDPYRVDLSESGMRASHVLEAGFGWCVTKAALLAASARAIAIPARLGFADVRNHLSTARLREQMQTDLFVWHGYTELWLDDRWIKATPAFNVELCDRFGLLPLDWDGESDSLYHSFDRIGNRHMEYVLERGTFDDVPNERIAADFAAAYPAWKIADADISFDADVAGEMVRT